MRRKIYKRIIAAVLSLIMIFSMTGIGTLTASAFDKLYISKDGMALGYSIINGYTRMYYKNNPDTATGKIAVYSSLDITSPYILAMGGMFFLTNSIDIDRLLTDNDYTMSYIDKFDSYLSSVGIVNGRASDFCNSIKDDNISFDIALDTVGIYVFEADKDYAYQLMDSNEYADFVLAEGKVPSNMKDLNLDGKTDSTDAELIQHYLAGDSELEDEDEKAYAMFASDYNKDTEINIIDVTDLQRDLIEKQ